MKDGRQKVCMETRKLLNYAGLVAACLLLWAVFSWPLPMHFSTGIPQSDHSREKGHVRQMIPGDQLQLMYHFWLASDMMAGKTPLFTNVYEFNQGKDEDLKVFDPYYAPYSWAFGIFHIFLSRAASWNLAGLLSILCTFGATFLLIKRITGDRLSAILAALLGASFPYRWIPLLTGSPTGFAISLIPLTALGLHIAVTDRKWTGGLLAGVGVFFSYCSDLHVFYFNTLSLPFWTLAFATLKKDMYPPSLQTLKKVAIAIAPAGLLTAAAAITGIVAGSRLDATDMASGRTWKLIIKYSPRSRGLFSWENLGMSNHVFLGHIAVLLALIVLIAVIYSVVKKKAQKQTTIFFALVFIASLCIISLALGANGLSHGIMMRACRKFIPKYTMIRQSVKVYCLMPLLLPLLIGLGSSLLFKLTTNRRFPRVLVCVLTLLCIAEWRMQISPAICTLADEEPAYAAIHSDAISRDVEPHAVVVPLWPGDSHWASLYEHYVSLYRIRMLNGYSPAIGNDYLESVFYPLESINVGVIDNEQIALLKSMKIDYLIFHEDAFPQQVSPYPASQTLFRLLAHPSLQLMKQSESIWAFKILGESTEPIRAEAPEFMLSTRGWEMESLLRDFGEIVEAPLASGTVLKLTAENAEMKSHDLPSAKGQQLNLRIKGNGAFTWRIKSSGEVIGSASVTTISDEWQWKALPFTSPAETFPISMEFSAPKGDVYLDMMFLTAGRQVSLKPGEQVTIPASAFYRAGYTDIETGSAILRQSTDPDQEILYGTFPLLERGTYQIKLDITSEEDTEPGAITYLAHSTHPFTVPIEKPGTFTHIYKHPNNVPVKIGFTYGRNADVAIHSLTLKRIE